MSTVKQAIAYILVYSNVDKRDGNMKGNVLHMYSINHAYPIS